MARSIETIQKTMDVQQATETSLSTLNSPSKVGIYTLWKFITSAIINYTEQLWDFYKSDLEAIVTAAPVGSAAWLQSEILKFQYLTGVPQVLEVDSNYAVNYETIDPTLRIITRCAIVRTGQRKILIKVAVDDPPVAMGATPLLELYGYADYKMNAGVNYYISSDDADEIYLVSDIYYDGQYASTIETSVIDAINNYLANIDFNGEITILKLTDAIQSVVGVSDILIHDLAIRSNATAFANKTYIVQNKTTLTTTYSFNAGYGVEETTASNTFADTLNFIIK